MTTFNTHTVEEHDDYYNALGIKYINDAPATNPNIGKKIYLAGPWFDTAALELCKFVEATIKHESGNKNTWFFPRQGGNSADYSPKVVFDLNVKHVSECDVLIAMVSRKDIGTAWEVGMAYALGKEIILLGYDESDFESKTNLMLAFCGKAITLKNLAKYLRGNMYRDDWFIFNANKWEGIE